MVDDDMKTWLFQLHNKLIGHQPLMKEVIYSCYFVNPFFRLHFSFSIGSLMNCFFSFRLLEYYLYSIRQHFLSKNYVRNVMCQILLLHLQMVMCIVMCVVWKQSSRRLVSYKLQLCQQLEIMFFLPLKENGWKLWWVC